VCGFIELQEIFSFILWYSVWSYWATWDLLVPVVIQCVVLLSYRRSPRLCCDIVCGRIELHEIFSFMLWYSVWSYWATWDLLVPVVIQCVVLLSYRRSSRLCCDTVCGLIELQEIFSFMLWYSVWFYWATWDLVVYVVIQCVVLLSYMISSRSCCDIVCGLIELHEIFSFMLWYSVWSYWATGDLLVYVVI
jgi:hypothetical protein